MRSQLSLKRVLIDGTILNILVSIIIYGSIYANPMTWVGDYPPDIQAAVGDAARVPLGQTAIVGVLCFGIVGGVCQQRADLFLLCGVGFGDPRLAHLRHHPAQLYRDPRDGRTGGL